MGAPSALLVSHLTEFIKLDIARLKQLPWGSLSSIVITYFRRAYLVPIFQRSLVDQDKVDI